MVKAKKNPSQKRVHSFRPMIFCGGIDCRAEFERKRKDQRFCSRSCKAKYFAIARTLGEMLLKRSERSKRYKGIVDGFLFQMRHFG